MKKKDIGSRLAFAGVGTAVSVIFILLGYYVRYVTLSCVVLTSIGILLPLSRGYFREAVLTAVVAGMIGFFIANIKIVPYVAVSGLYVVFTVFLQQKFSDKTWKILIGYLIKLGYSSLVFWILYKLLSLLVVDVTKIAFLSVLDATTLYAVFNIVFSLAFLAYDYLLVKGYDFAKEKIKKIGHRR